jgi:hypothetical protein
MLDRIVQTSEAPRTDAGQASERLIPALCGCEVCGTKRLIAPPSIGVCADCGTELRVLESGTASRACGQEAETLSPYAA